MGEADRIFRWSFTLLFGIGAAAGLATVTALLWWPLFWFVFSVLSVCWVGLVIDGIRKQNSGENLAILNRSRDWQAKELPAEFQFIDRDTTIGEITQKIGPYSKVRGEDDVQAAQFNLPNKCALLVFAEPPLRPQSRVRGIRFYRDRDFIELFP